MLIKLTHSGSDRPTIVNIEKVESMYQIWDKSLKSYVTKICFTGNISFVTVEEDLQTIMKLVRDYVEGIYQSTEWETNSISEHMEKFFNFQNELSTDTFNDFKY